MKRCLISKVRPGLSQLLLLLWLMLASTGSLASIQVQVDRDQIARGDIFNVIFSTTEAGLYSPDFSPLNRDFTIISNSQSKNWQFSNGQQSQIVSWRLELFAVKEGNLTIPAINFGNKQSEALDIYVSAETPNQPAQQKDVMVEVLIEPEEPYVQQQIIVRQRLLHSVNLSQSQASMTHPEWLDTQGSLQQLGQPIYTTEQRDGITYRVIERRYAAFAHKSGDASLAMTTFDGVIETAQRQRDPFFGIRGERVRRHSPPKTFTVKPQPSDVSGEWLPARSLSLNAYWDPTSTQIKAGEPVKLNLAIIADGLLAEQLPALSLQPPMGLRAYAEQPELRNDVSAGSVVGIREEQWTIVGTADGELTLPAINVQWWDLKKNALQIASLPVRTFTVSGANTASSLNTNSLNVLPATPDNSVVSAPESQANQNDGEAASTTSSASNAFRVPTLNSQWFAWLPSVKPINWQRLALPFGALGLVALLIGFLVARRQQPAAASASEKIWGARYANGIGLQATEKAERLKKTATSSASQVLKHACERNDAPVALDALNRWIHEESPLSPPTLANLRAHSDESLRTALDVLNAALYAPKQATSWQGKGLWQALQGFQQAQRAQSVRPASGLAVLYPE